MRKAARARDLGGRGCGDEALETENDEQQLHFSSGNRAPTDWAAELLGIGETRSRNGPKLRPLDLMTGSNPRADQDLTWQQQGDPVYSGLVAAERGAPKG